MFRLPESLRSRLSLLGLGVFLLALLFRSIGIQWGLPGPARYYSLHPDETDILVYSQQVNPFAGDFDPGFYNYGTLYLSVIRVADTFVDAYGGGPKDKSPEAMANAMHNYILTGRWISAMAGALLAWIVVALLLRATHWGGAVFGGLFIAVSPGLMVHSRFQTVDIFAVMLLALALYWAVRAYEATEHELSSSTKYFIYSGLFAGLSAGTKYTGILVLLVLIPIALRPGRALRWKELLAGFGAGLVSFVLATPGSLTNTARFMHDFKFEMAHTSAGHGLVFAGTAPGFLYHIGNLLEATGMILVGIGLVGAFSLFRPALDAWRTATTTSEAESTELPKAWIIGMLFFMLAYYVLIGRAEVKFLRYVFPLIPGLAILAGMVFGNAIKAKQKAWWVIGAMGIGGIFGGGLTQSATYMAYMIAQDPRDAAADYLHKKAEAVGLVSDPWFYSPSLYPSIGAPRAVPLVTRDQDRLAAKHPSVILFPNEYGPREPWDYNLIDEYAPEYIVFSSFERDDMERLVKLPHPDPEYVPIIERYKTFMTKLTAQYGADATFGQGGSMTHDMMYVRPRIWIWKRNPVSTN